MTTSGNGLKIAIVGAGPAGFYAAGQLLANDELNATINLFDRLPTPFGLVRFGVAPDHPKIKSVTRVFDRTAAKERFNFFGNVEIGKHISHDELVERHHAVIYTTGASQDRRLGIPGEDLPGSVAATDFVAWYNGHPDAKDFNFDLSGKTAVVIGNGNVALDVARMLALSPDELATTDTADHAIAALKQSNVKEIIVLGRRGPAQAAYTNPELLELGELEIADVKIDARDAELDAGSVAWLQRDGSDLREKKNVEIAAGYAERTATDKPKTVHLKFLGSPVEIVGNGKVEGIRVVRNELIADTDGWLSARPTSEIETIQADIVLRSIGYRGSPISGVPFDEDRATLNNLDGRIVDHEHGNAISGLYTAGWVKRGPSGVIGTNKKCAQDTVDELVKDHEEGKLNTPTVTDSVANLVNERQPDAISFADWQKIDAAEKAAGEAQGRPRVKFVDIAEMVKVARA